MHINQGIESRDELRNLRKAGGRRWVRIALGVMVVALAGWYFLGGDIQHKLKVEDRNLSETLDVSAAGRVSLAIDGVRDRSQEKSLETSLSAVVIKKGERAREMIKRTRDQGEKIDLSEMFHHAERFRGQGMLADAHLMYFFVAKRGHAESALVLGTMYDPKHALEVPSIIEEPSWTQAHKWYLRAAERGNKAAKKHLEYLRKQVDRAAIDGDPEAARLVLQWQ